MWIGDTFLVICQFLGDDCAVMELVCWKFRNNMSTLDFWTEITRRAYPDLPLAGLSLGELRALFFPPNEWDTALMTAERPDDEDEFPDTYPYSLTLSITDLRVTNRRRTLEGLKDAPFAYLQWKFVKCVKPLPKEEGCYFCYALDVELCNSEVPYVS